ncbi:hypothetical protein G6F61_014484 [Rhizopus arrhizus]|nr:hypothetical protein G6F61_014484 [Rhizopus arrhizus]
MRRDAPLIAACSGRSPASRRSRIACISTRPCKVATPETAMKPTAADTENGMPRSSSARMPPTSANGTQLNTRMASLPLRRAMNSSLPISRNTTGTAVASRFSARCRFSNWPPQVR